MELPRQGEDPVLSMQLSLFYKLESLLCCTQFLNWRLCALWALSTPAGGLEPEAGLERAEGSGLCAPVPSLEQRGQWTVQQGPLTQLASLSPEQAVWDG